MAGIIDQAAQAAQPQGATPAADADISPAGLMAKMHLSAEQKPQLERIVEAGKRVMFDKSTHHLMLETMQGDAPIEQKIGGGVVSLLGMLWNESKQSLPPELIIPAGVILVAEAVDFLNKAGEPVTPEQNGAATEFMVDALLNGAKGDEGSEPNPEQPGPQGMLQQASPQGATA